MSFLNRIRVRGQNIYIQKKNFFLKDSSNLNSVMRFADEIPIINIFDDELLIRSFVIEPLISNPELKGQFLHFSISVQENDAVMIDCILSRSQYSHLTWKDEKYESIRLQPFFLTSSGHQNDNLIGKGLFERGLHFTGTITPMGVRCVCICDYCKKSFTLQSIHAGFSNVQYFYSLNGKRTLLVPYDEVENIPIQLDDNITEQLLEEVELELTRGNNDGYKYYNSLNCSHCSKPFINFINNKTMRPKEYYANKFINNEFYYLTAEV